MTNANEAQIAAFLSTYSLTDAQIAGILGNMQQESGFQPLPPSMDSNGLYSGGIVQWNGPRLASLQSFVKGEGGSGDGTVGQELGYLHQELAGPYANALTAVKATDTPAGAAQAWNATFEKGSDPNGVRESNANNIAPSVPTLLSAGEGTANNAGLLTQGASAVGGVLYSIPGVSTVVGGVKNVISGTEAVGTFLAWISNSQNLLRVGYVVLGGVMVLVGAGKLIGVSAPSGALGVVGKMV